MVDIDLILSIVLAAFVFLIIFPGIPLIVYICRKKAENDIYQKILDESDDVTESDIRQIEYSEKTLEYFNKLISSVCTTSFQEWSDTRIKDKITLTQFQELVKKSSEQVFNAIDNNKLRWGILLYTDSFYTWYLTHVTIYTMKRILRDNFIEIID